MSRETLTRRQAMLAAGAALAQVKRAAAQTVALKPGKFFTAQELALLDELAELIIPQDAQSGGARAAKCAEFIDAHLAESIDPLWRQSWKDDLAEIDEIATQMLGKSLLAASPAERTKLMDRISRNERNPQEACDFAFGVIKWWVAEAYYTSQIGIQDELKYQGNIYLDEFLGTDVSRKDRP